MMLMYTAQYIEHKGVDGRCSNVSKKIERVVDLGKLVEQPAVDGSHTLKVASRLREALKVDPESPRDASEQSRM